MGCCVSSPAVTTRKTHSIQIKPANRENQQNNDNNPSVHTHSKSSKDNNKNPKLKYSIEPAESHDAGVASSTEKQARKFNSKNKQTESEQQNTLNQPIRQDSNETVEINPARNPNNEVITHGILNNSRSKSSATPNKSSTNSGSKGNPNKENKSNNSSGNRPNRHGFNRLSVDTSAADGELSKIPAGLATAPMKLGDEDYFASQFNATNSINKLQPNVNSTVSKSANNSPSNRPSNKRGSMPDINNPGSNTNNPTARVSANNNRSRRSSLSIQPPRSIKGVADRKSNTQKLNDEGENIVLTPPNGSVNQRFPNGSIPETNLSQPPMGSNSNSKNSSKSNSGRETFDFEYKANTHQQNTQKPRRSTSKTRPNETMPGSSPALTPVVANFSRSGTTNSMKVVMNNNTNPNSPIVNSPMVNIRNSPKISATSEPIESMQVYSFLQLTPFSYLLTEQQLKDFANYFELHTYRPKSTVFIEGSESDTLYIVKSGSILIQADKAIVDDGIKVHAIGASSKNPNSNKWKLLNRKQVNTLDNNSNTNNNGNNSPVVTASNPNSGLQVVNLATKSSTQIFGAESLRSKGHLRFYTVFALYDTQLLQLTKSNFDNFCNLYPGLGPKINNLLGLHMETRLLKSDYFETLNEAHIQLFINCSNHRQYLTGHILYEINKPVTTESSLYFIDSGSIRLEQIQALTEEKTEKSLDSGDLFGMDCVLLDIARNSTAMIKSNAILIELQRKHLRQFLLLCPSLLSNLHTLIEESPIVLYELLNPGGGHSILNSHYSEAFREFCASELSLENWNFYTNANKYRKNTKHDNIKLEATRIYHQYIANNAAELININGNTRTKIMKCIKELDSVDNTLFQSAETEILALMSSDTYTRFKVSPMFLRTVKEVNTKLEFALHKKFQPNNNGNKQPKMKRMNSRLASTSSGEEELKSNDELSEITTNISGVNRTPTANGKQVINTTISNDNQTSNGGTAITPTNANKRSINLAVNNNAEHHSSVYRKNSISGSSLNAAGVSPRNTSVIKI